MIKIEFLGQAKVRTLLSILIKDFPLSLSFPKLFCKGKIKVFYHKTWVQLTALNIDEAIKIERAANGLGTV
jgi:hypothetical protein